MSKCEFLFSKLKNWWVGEPFSHYWWARPNVSSPWWQCPCNAVLVCYNGPIWSYENREIFWGLLKLIPWVNIQHTLRGNNRTKRTPNVSTIILTLRVRFPKIHDFVPFAIYQNLVKLLFTLFSKNLKNWTVKIFGGLRAISEKWKENFKKIVMKLKIWYPYGLRITYTTYEWKWRIFFFCFKGPLVLFWFSKSQCWDFDNNYRHRWRHKLRGQIALLHCYGNLFT